MVLTGPITGVDGGGIEEVVVVDWSDDSSESIGHKNIECRGSEVRLVYWYEYCKDALLLWKSLEAGSGEFWSISSLFEWLLLYDDIADSPADAEHRRSWELI